MIVGPAQPVPMPKLPPRGAPESDISWLKMNCSMTVMPAPPYSFGHAGAIQPWSASFFTQAPFVAKYSSRDMRMSSQPPPPNAARKPRRLMPAGHSFSMNARTSARNAASTGVS